MFSPDYYILINKKPVIAKDIEEWGKFFQSKERIIAQDRIVTGDITTFISTVFIGIKSFDGTLFETMIFINDNSQYAETYNDYESAEQNHKSIVESVKAGKLYNGNI